MEERTTTKLKELEEEKERLLRQYMGMQDQADDLNGQIYRVCCDIEILNRRIDLAREEELKKQQQAAAKAAAKGLGKANGNGDAKPSNGNGSH